MIHKQFAERLNHELDQMGLPLRTDERVTAFAKLIDVHNFTAENLLTGSILPDGPILERLSQELEVSMDWLLNKDSAG